MEPETFRLLRRIVGAVVLVIVLLFPELLPLSALSNIVESAKQIQRRAHMDLDK